MAEELTVSESNTGSTRTVSRQEVWQGVSVGLLLGVVAVPGTVIFTVPGTAGVFQAAGGRGLDALE